MTEVKAADGQDVPVELKQAVLGFVNELKGFRNDIQNRLDEQELRMTKLDRKTALRNRAPLSTVAEIEAPHQKAFDAYLRRGDDAALRGLALEEKGMTVTSDGGFLAAPQVAEAVQGALTVPGSLRSVANVVTVESATYEVLVQKEEMGSAWANEISSVETDAGQIERIQIPVHELAAMPKASQRLLDDAAFDVEGWLAERIVTRFARAESAAFINGDGVDKPKGILSYPQIIDTSVTLGKIGFIKTGEGGALPNTNPMAPLLGLIYALGVEYRANAVFLMNSSTAAALRKLRDADGRFLWADQTGAEPSRLLGYPVVISEDMPSIGVDKPAIVFGDLRAAYTIVERPDLRVLRDPFSAKPHVLFYATKRVGGGVTDTRALKVLRFSV